MKQSKYTYNCPGQTALTLKRHMVESNKLTSKPNDGESMVLTDDVIEPDVTDNGSLVGPLDRTVVD